MLFNAVLFDLDDTLYDQFEWLMGAFSHMGEAVSAAGGDGARLASELLEVARLGSDQGRVIDRALERVGTCPLGLAELLEIFFSYRPDHLQPYPGLIEPLRRLADLVPLGLVTDGHPSIQRDKVTALGLEGLFQVVVCSDDLGRHLRKPAPEPFLEGCKRLGTSPSRAVFVGDRPSKDSAGAIAAGLIPVRVRTGEYRHQVDLPGVTAFDDAASAVGWLIGVLDPDER